MVYNGLVPIGCRARVAGHSAARTERPHEDSMARQPRHKQSQSAIGLFSALGIDPSAVPRARPLYRRLVEIVERGVARGALHAGFRLPPERDLAAALRVSRATIVAAYRELEARGLARAYVGRRSEERRVGKECA